MRTKQYNMELLKKYSSTDFDNFSFHINFSIAKKNEKIFFALAWEILCIILKL